MTILAFDQHARLAAAVVDGKNDNRSRVPHHVATHAHACGFENFVRRYPEHRAGIGLPR